MSSLTVKRQDEIDNSSRIPQKVDGWSGVAGIVILTCESTIRTSNYRLPKGDLRSVAPIKVKQAASHGPTGNEPWTEQSFHHTWIRFWKKTWNPRFLSIMWGSTTKPPHTTRPGGYVCTSVPKRQRTGMVIHGCDSWHMCKRRWDAS